MFSTHGISHLHASMPIFRCALRLYPFPAYIIDNMAGQPALYAITAKWVDRRTDHVRSVTITIYALVALRPRQIAFVI